MTIVHTRPEADIPGRTSTRPLPRDATSPALRRAVAASYIGSAVEFYDFHIYATAAALVFPQVFFPSLGATMGAVASLGSFASAFLARPFGALVFGHFGDRLGRKRTLMATLLLMGLSTFAVGLLPSTATIGIAAPIVLVALRLVQGFAVGGEWAGAALLCVENSPRRLRGRCCMFMQLGIGTAVVLANLAFLLSHSVFLGQESAFISWGWRVPFLLSAVLAAVGFSVRRHLGETADYAAATGSAATGSDAPGSEAARLPFADLLRRQTPQLLLTAGAVVGAAMLLYQAGTFLTGFAKSQLHYPIDDIFAISAVGGVCLMAGIAASGFLVDRFGCRRIAVLGYGIAVPWSLAILPLIHTDGAMFFGAAMLVTYAIGGLVMSPLAALIPTVFAVRHRYTGAAMANNLGVIVGGAIPPVISPLLMARGGGAVGVMMAAFALLSLVSVLSLRPVDDSGPEQKCSA